jgi:hypothetical protein
VAHTKNWSISKQIRTGMLLVVVLLATQAAVGVITNFIVREQFTEYRATARESLLASEMALDAAETRLASFRYRTEDSQDYL